MVDHKDHTPLLTAYEEADLWKVHELLKSGANYWVLKEDVSALSCCINGYETAEHFPVQHLIKLFHIGLTIGHPHIHIPANLISNSHMNTEGMLTIGSPLSDVFPNAIHSFAQLAHYIHSGGVFKYKEELIENLKDALQNKVSRVYLTVPSSPHNKEGGPVDLHQIYLMVRYLQRTTSLRCLCLNYINSGEFVLRYPKFDQKVHQLPQEMQTTIIPPQHTQRIQTWVFTETETTSQKQSEPQYIYQEDYTYQDEDWDLQEEEDVDTEQE
eukprot:TRINITY_DN7509_c0_g3_i1.p1 TRINITY_DN7509_c0_g3~~TRINITY_DN7509_c0_g3_i1.p1  ORF type:complete len:311 (+),score=70.87 TRINITY_DN7509_c0_g3_i1:128-934(+)